MDNGYADIIVEADVAQMFERFHNAMGFKTQTDAIRYMLRCAELMTVDPYNTGEEAE